MIRPRIERMARIARWRRNRSRGRVLILLYHRIVEVRSDPWGLSVAPRHFSEHLEILSERTQPIRLQQLPEAVFGDSSEDFSVIVTFDDGYADNLHNAKPLLERYAIPATVFLTTGHIGGERAFWWDDLEQLLLQPGTLPEVLCLSVGGSTYRWELGESAHYGEDASRRYRSWRAWKYGAPSSRHRLYRSLWKLMHPMSQTERQGLLNQLREWAKGEPANHPIHRSLTLDEVGALAQGQLIELGAHTVTHPTLSALPAASQRHEIQQSKTTLERILGYPVSSFAYPHGGRSDYTAETVSIVQEEGFARACSNFAGVVGQSTNPFQLPRFHVQDWGGQEFARRLSRWSWLSRWFHD